MSNIVTRNIIPVYRYMRQEYYKYMTLSSQKLGKDFLSSKMNMKLVM